jgi:hypothetical protein
MTQTTLPNSGASIGSEHTIESVEANSTGSNLPNADGVAENAIAAQGVEEASQPKNPSWRAPSSIELLDPSFASKLAEKWEERLGCAVWFVRRTCRGKIADSVASRTARELTLSAEAISSIASDSSQSNMPIGLNCNPQLPLSPSAILNRIALTHPEYAALSSHFEMTTVPGGWVVVLAWRYSEDRQESLSFAAAMDLDGPTLGKVLEAYTVSKMGHKCFSIVDKVTFFRSLNKYWVFATVAAILIFLCIPVPYRASRDCILEPSTRRFVSSPIEGRLTAIAVRPGEEVTEGQLLASIDDQPIRRELLIAEAELQSANKRRDVALATKASGDLRLAQLECQQIQLKMDSIREQLGRLEIRSPSSGVIVQGDWFGNEGMPVTLGQSLFEIAPLDRMTAEIQLTAEDLPWVKSGSQAVLRTDATGTMSWPSTLARIEPHAEIIDDKAVYIAEMDVENTSKLFRPGMKGKTVVDTGSHTIGWLLLSKPYRWLVNMWVW